jgi:hypothetical protein
LKRERRRGGGEEEEEGTKTHGYQYNCQVIVKFERLWGV